MPPLFAGKTIVTDEPRVCGIPGIVVYILPDCTTGVTEASLWRPLLLSAGQRWQCKGVQIERLA